MFAAKWPPGGLDSHNIVLNILGIRKKFCLKLLDQLSRGLFEDFLNLEPNQLVVVCPRLCLLMPVIVPGSAAKSNYISL